jgi:hypothetical protein
MATRFSGVRRIRRTLRAIPETARSELAALLQEFAPRIGSAIRARAPSRTGALRAAITSKAFPRTLKIRAGLTKARSRRVFYGRIQEFGRKAQTVRITRGPRRGASLRVRAMAAKRFVSGRMPEVRSELRARLNRLWDRVLGKAARGGGGDD